MAKMRLLFGGNNIHQCYLVVYLSFFIIILVSKGKDSLLLMDVG